MEYKDYYKILGVDKKASQADIKKAYRNFAKKYHPDKNKDDKTAEEKFKNISEAYEVLGNDEKRAQYDQLGSNWRQYQQTGGPGYGSRQYRQEGGFGGGFNGGGGFSDFFEQFFSGSGGAGGFGNTGGESYAPKGQDYETHINLTLQEAYLGATRLIEVNGQQLRITTKPGVSDGQVLRIKGKGGPAMGGRGVAGDLFVNITIAPHPVLERKGNDLYITSKIDMYTAILGGEAHVNTLDGQLKLKIPGGTQPGKTLRLRGKGMPVYGSAGQFGDLYVQIEVSLPTIVSQQEADLLLKLRDLQKHTAS
ncbi:DnaJ C-terminal domain-containing protein [Pontibacter arcticus]|uniref:J domain-containing protein n=1 Tax=Pontibacter arcticus TaxID=2080288 RepID=A0A364RG13_9BACT|nr:J domain-containing protein [Pontibacter arcticus]RAU83195.1 J domain-containing protein [Pontibacter arcticus]